MWNSRSPGVDGAWCRPPVQLDERVQLGRPRTGEQPVPGVGADRGDHRQALGRDRGSRWRAPARRCRPARRGRRPRRLRRWWPPGRWRRASTAPVPVAAEERAPSDPSESRVGMMVKMVNHVGKCTGAVRVHRRVAVAVPRLRDRRAAAERRGVHRTVRTRRVAEPGAGSSPCAPDRWSRGGPTRPTGRAVPDRRRPHRQPQSAGQAAPRPVRLRLAGGRPAALRRGVAELVAGPRPRHQRPAVGARRQHHRPPAGPHRRADPARAAAGDPPGRGPQVGVAGPAAARQRGLGRRQRPPVVPRLRRRAGRASTPPTCSAPT